MKPSKMFPGVTGSLVDSSNAITQAVASARRKIALVAGVADASPKENSEPENTTRSFQGVVRVLKSKTVDGREANDSLLGESHFNGRQR